MRARYYLLSYFSTHQAVAKETKLLRWCVGLLLQQELLFVISPRTRMASIMIMILDLLVVSVTFIFYAGTSRSTLFPPVGVEER